MGRSVSGTTEAFARVKIALLKDVGWNLTVSSSVMVECGLPDRTSLPRRHGFV